MSNYPFPVDPVLTGIAIAYRNNRMIADDVLPRVDTMGKQEFKYNFWDTEEVYTILDTKVGRKGVPQEVEFNATEVPDSTVDYGLDDVIPADDIANAMGTVDPRNRAVRGIMELVSLDREKRTADLVFAAATYPAGNKVQLAGVDQWSDFTNSDPIDDIMVGLDAPLVRPNIMVIGRAAFTKLIQHPDLNKAVNQTAGDKGVVRRDQVAAIFELDEVIVGEGWLNSAKVGQAATYVRLWGKHAALLHRNPLATSLDSPPTFGLTFQYGTRVAGSIPEPKVGLRGAERVRAGESVVEHVVASGLGYFIEDAVA